MRLQSTDRNTVFLNSLAVLGSKLAEVADDVNKVVSQVNQDDVTVTQDGNTITVSGRVNELNSFASTDPNQGTAKWIGLVIDTGESDITKVTYNGSALTQADVEDAASVGQGAGKFILWIKAEVVAETPKTFTLGTQGKEDTTITVIVEDTSI